MSQPPAFSQDEVRSLLAAAPAATPPPDASALLARLGFHDRSRAWANLRALWAHCPAADLAELAPRLLEALAAGADPDMALNNLDRVLAACPEPGSLVSAWLREPRALAATAELCATSQWLADILRETAPTFMAQLAGPTGPAAEPASRLQDRAEAAVRGAGPGRSGQLDALRRFKRSELLRVGSRDILRLVSFGELVAEISDLAVVCVRAALEMCREGTAAPAVPNAPADWHRAFSVIALGKLGGHELNYSSDVDLLFVCDARWAREGLAPDPVRRYFNRLAQSLVEALGSLTGDGGLFRVDMRLRPEGGAGALVRTLQAYATYYESWAAVWERQALIKASYLAGDEALAARFLDMAGEVTYGKRVDTAGVAEIKAVKDRIEASARRAGGERNVKLGPGCIRDIEFTVQLLQLVFGAGDPTVRRRSTLGALRALGSAGYLTPMEHKTLASGYVFLRTVEHQLQLMHGLGVRELPGSPEALDKLARRLDFPEDASTVPAEFLLGEYRRHTGNVRGLFRKLFAEMFEERDEADIRARSLVFLPDEPTEEETGALAAFGLRDTARAAATLRRLARGTVAAPLPASAAEAFADLAPRILRAASKTPDPDASLTQFERFCGLIGSHGALYSVLAEAPPVTELLIRVAGCSASLSAILAAHPEYFDMLMDPLLMSAPRTADKLAGELAVRLEETRTGEAGMKVIGRFRRRELLRIGVRDLMGDADVLTTMRELSALGDVCLQAALAAVAPEVVDHPADGLPFAVVGLGKLAGRELHYNSDLDVVFVWGECEGGPSDRQAAYMRLAGEIMARATAATSGEGPPLRLDARLRPEGNSGPLARSVASCREYYAGRAEPWERLALVRLRPVAGSPAVAEEFGQVIEQFVWGRGLSPAELDEIVHLKGRMERERAKTAGGLIDVKLGPGGISDIEFCVQLLQLAHGHAEPTVRAPGTLDGLRALARAGAFPSEQDGAALEAAYLFLRALECRLQIAQAWDQSTVSPGAVDRLERLMDRPGREDRPPAEALAGELDRHRRLARGLYEATVERLAGRSADTPGGVSSV